MYVGTYMIACVCICISLVLDLQTELDGFQNSNILHSKNILGFQIERVFFKRYIFSLVQLHFYLNIEFSFEKTFTSFQEIVLSVKSLK